MNSVFALEQSVLRKKKPQVKGLSISSAPRHRALTSTLVTQKIYHNGKINQVQYVADQTAQVNYKYVDSSNQEHDLGTFDIVWAQRWKRGTSTDKSSDPANWKKVVSGGRIRYYEYDSDNKAPLIRPFKKKNGLNVFEYINGNLKIVLYEDTSREYFNPESFGCILGALADTGFEDVVCNGSVGLDGTGAYSVTHVNGINTDFKYLRTDQKKGNIDQGIYRILVSDTNLDVTRQNQLLDAFYKFGWGRTSKMLSHYMSDGGLLNHTKKANHHHNHLHIQGYAPNYQ